MLSVAVPLKLQATGAGSFVCVAGVRFRMNPVACCSHRACSTPGLWACCRRKSCGSSCVRWLPLVPRCLAGARGLPAAFASASLAPCALPAGSAASSQPGARLSLRLHLPPPCPSPHFPTWCPVSSIISPSSCLLPCFLIFCCLL